MKTIQKISALILLTLLFLSCSKDDDKVVQKTLLLKRTVDSDDNLTSVYTYNDANQLVNYSRNGSPNNPSANQDFTYNSNGTLAKVTNVSDGSIVAKYFYDSNKKLIKKEGRNGVDIYMYEYAANQVTEKYIFTPTQYAFNQVYKYDNNGNVIEIIVYNNVSASNPNGTLNGTLQYTYDTKIAATKSLPKEYLFPNYNTNNLLSERNNNDPVYTYTLVYNENDYLTKRISNFERTYEYQ